MTPAIPRFTLLLVLICWAGVSAAPGAANAESNDLAPLLGEPRFESVRVFDDQRLPNIAVALDGTVIAQWGWTDVSIRRSADGGKTWGETISLGKGINAGGLTVDETTGDILAFAEDKHPPAPLRIYRSTDHGKTWKPQEVVIQPNSLGHVPSMSMNEHGITLHRGKHKGRLIRPSRWYADGNRPESLFPTHYTNAIFSDDGGKTWQASEPFPAMGTGEAAIAELSDGTLYYNSRRHWAPEGVNARRRWIAQSKDGGKTWTNLWMCDQLPDGDQARDYGLMGGLIRLPVQGRDILLFSNIVSPKGRTHGHVWVSFDGGKTWPHHRLITEGKFAYSSLSVGRAGTPSEGWVYLLYESGPTKSGTVARFNLSWLLDGKSIDSLIDE